VFAVLYVGALMTFGGPETTDEVEKDPTALAKAWSDYYADSGNRNVMLVGGLVLLVAALAMVVFGSALRDRLSEGGAPGAGRLAFAGSILFGAVTMAGACAFIWIPGAKTFGESAVPTGELAYLASQLGYSLILLAGGAAAGFMLVVAGWTGARTHSLPGWLGWAGVVVGVIVFFTAAIFVPMALLVLWVLVTSIVMLRRPAPV
jgi:hypothetical protein